MPDDLGFIGTARSILSASYPKGGWIRLWGVPLGGDLFETCALTRRLFEADSFAATAASILATIRPSPVLMSASPVTNRT